MERAKFLTKLKQAVGRYSLHLPFHVRDGLNEHPYKNEPQPRLICSILNGAPIKADQINEVMKQLRKRIERLLKNGEIIDKIEKEKLECLLKTKRWNPYCIRHCHYS